MNILISACLLGIPCRYDGKSKEYPNINLLKTKHNLIPFCPEIYGGLATPRDSAEICGSKVLTKANIDVTKNYKKGAEIALDLAKSLNITCAVLKSKSPSCGIGQVYDGTFSKTLISGDGICAKLLKENNLTVFSENNLEELLK